jgi:hypothetical protein
MHYAILLLTIAVMALQVSIIDVLVSDAFSTVQLLATVLLLDSTRCSTSPLTTPRLVPTEN